MKLKVYSLQNLLKYNKLFIKENLGLIKDNLYDKSISGNMISTLIHTFTISDPSFRTNSFHSSLFFRPFSSFSDAISLNVPHDVTQVIYSCKADAKLLYTGLLAESAK